VEGVKAAVFPAEKQGKEAGYGNLMGDMNRGKHGAVFAAVREWLGTWKKVQIGKHRTRSSNTGAVTLVLSYLLERYRGGCKGTAFIMVV
jgi:hypothetical protein